VLVRAYKEKKGRKIKREKGLRQMKKNRRKKGNVRQDARTHCSEHKE
jgi:hypothetical protein